MAKKNMNVTYKNVYIVVSTKGGEGKTFLSLQILPVLFLNRNINIFEVDNNNNSKKMIENSQKISFKSFKIEVAFNLSSFYLTINNIKFII